SRGVEIGISSKILSMNLRERTAPSPPPPPPPGGGGGRPPGGACSATCGGPVGGIFLGGRFLGGPLPGMGATPSGLSPNRAECPQTLSEYPGPGANPARGGLFIETRRTTPFSFCFSAARRWSNLRGEFASSYCLLLEGLIAAPPKNKRKIMFGLVFL